MQQPGDADCIDDVDGTIYDLTGQSCPVVLRRFAEMQQWPSLPAACSEDVSVIVGLTMLQEEPLTYSSCLPTDQSGSHVLSDGDGFGHFEEFYFGDMSWDDVQYAPMSECSWLASCSNGPVTVMFHELALADSDDVLVLYDGEDGSAPVLETLDGDSNFDGDLMVHSVSSSGSSIFMHFTSGEWDEDIGIDAMVFCPAEHGGLLSSYCPVTCDGCSPSCEVELDAGLERNTAMQIRDPSEMSTGTGSVEYEALVGCLQTQGTYGLGYSDEPLVIGDSAEEVILQNFGYASPAGARCTACGPGSEPAADGASCVQCGEYEYSAGSRCMVCPPGTKLAQGKSTCEICPSSGGKYSPYGKTCLTCPVGSEPMYYQGQQIAGRRLEEDYYSGSGPSFLDGPGGQNMMYSYFLYSGATSCEQCSDIAATAAYDLFAAVRDEMQSHCSSEYQQCLQRAADPGCVDDADGLLNGITGATCDLSVRQLAEAGQVSLSGACSTDLASVIAQNMLTASPIPSYKSCPSGQSVEDTLTDGEHFGTTHCGEQDCTGTADGACTKRHTVCTPE
eukprot:COSAG06_NODE_3073_length_5891_cov_13.072514_1_plen_560_part_00